MLTLFFSSYLALVLALPLLFDNRCILANIHHRYVRMIVPVSFDPPYRESSEFEKLEIYKKAKAFMFTDPDRRNFYIVARSCVFEYIAILDVLNDKSIIEAPPYTKKKATQAQSAKSQQGSHVNCDFAFGPEKAIACAQIASNISGYDGD